MGWVTSELPGGDHHVIKVELKGPENTLRVRQVKVLGWKDGESIKILGQISASMAQQKNCEAETLRVFRLITSQVCPKSSCCWVCLKPFKFAHTPFLLESLGDLNVRMLFSFRSLENSSVETQNRLQNRRRKTCFPHPREKTRSAPSHCDTCI